LKGIFPSRLTGQAILRRNDSFVRVPCHYLIMPKDFWVNPQNEMGSSAFAIGGGILH